jgi:GT2 family glycosyltransferase
MSAPLHARTDDITVVVVSRNRREELLASLPRHEAPVVLVDNASTDGTAEAVANELPDVTLVRLQRNMGAAARTLGVRVARTPFVAFADDDSWWAPGALSRAVDLLRAHERVALLAARVLVGPGERVDTICDEMAASPLPLRGDEPGPRLLGFVACASVVRRQPFLDVGGFDSVVRFPGEEARVAVDLAAGGWDLVYTDDLVVHHHPSPRRDDPDRRRARLLRSSVLTALMRRPWSVVGSEFAAVLRSGRTGRRALVTALPDAPAALRARRRLPASVERQLALLGPSQPSRTS